MSVLGPYLPPTSSLPPIRSLEALTEEQISLALHNLHFLYCPLRPFRSHLKSRKPSRTSIRPTPADSGYASRNEDEDDDDADSDAEDAAAALRADGFERSFAVRWLTTFIARADSSLQHVGSEDAAQRLIDDAATILASFSEATDPDSDDEDAGLTREFSFAVAGGKEVSIRLNDAPLKGTDHTAVGLQSWGAAIVLSDLLCAAPDRFGLSGRNLATVVELGAGTGLVSLTVAALLHQQHPGHPSPAVVVATDFHPAVLANLRRNVETNASPVLTRPLDWSAPVLDAAPPLPLARRGAAVLLAADVVYAPEHATWLRDVAAELLAEDGVFWLIATVRNAGRGGKFEGIVDTVEAAFGERERAEGDGRCLAILGVEWVEKRRGVGRGDESGYKLYKIGWA